MKTILSHLKLILFSLLVISLFIAINYKKRGVLIPDGVVKPDWVVDIELSDGDNKFLVSPEKRYIADWVTFPCGEACSAGAYVIAGWVDFDNVRLFTLDDKQVLLELIDTNKENKQYCKSVNKTPYKLNNVWSDNAVYAHKTYELDTQKNKILLTGLPKEINSSNKVMGQFCKNGYDIYFSTLLDKTNDQLNKVSAKNVYRVLVIADLKKT